jgi:hypothetical protein
MADLDKIITITKFDGTDFSLWKDKIINALKASDCEDSIKEKFKLEGDEDVLKRRIKKDDTNVVNTGQHFKKTPKKRSLTNMESFT